MSRQGLAAGDAVGRPRWHADTPGPPQSTLAVEARMPQGVLSGLRARGHRVDVGPELAPAWGPVSVVSIDPQGVRRAAADPRIGTATADGD